MLKNYNELDVDISELIAACNTLIDWELECGGNKKLVYMLEDRRDYYESEFDGLDELDELDE